MLRDNVYSRTKRRLATAALMSRSSRTSPAQVGAASSRLYFYFYFYFYFFSPLSASSHLSVLLLSSTSTSTSISTSTRFSVLLLTSTYSVYALHFCESSLAVILELHLSHTSTKLSQHVPNNSCVPTQVCGLSGSCLDTSYTGQVLTRK